MMKLIRNLVLVFIMLCCNIRVIPMQASEFEEPSAHLETLYTYKDHESVLKVLLDHGDYNTYGTIYNFYLWDQEDNYIREIEEFWFDYFDKNYDSINDQSGYYYLSFDTSDLEIGTYQLSIECTYLDYSYVVSKESPYFYEFDLKEGIVVENITLSDHDIDMYMNETYQLYHQIEPSNASDQSVTYSSNNPNVVSVTNDGKIKAVGTGLAYITVQNEYGVKDRCCVYVEEDDFPFVDVKENDWYYHTVKQVYRNELMTGTSINYFEPNIPMTRAMVVMVLYRMEKEPNIGYIQKFSDVKNNLWYSKAITWANQSKIVSGYEDGRFGVDDPITREDLAVLLRNYANSMGIISKQESIILTNYKDYQKISSYAYSAIQWAVANELMGSVDELNPLGNATRAEAAKMFLKVLNMK